jgi:hypothetical protein
MLALTSPISNLQSLYSPEFKPGVQFALDLTENNGAMTERESFLPPRTHETSVLNPLTENASAFSFQRCVRRLVKFSTVLGTNVGP